MRTVLGVSNMSFGLPLREIVNATFLAAAFSAGLDMPILNPLPRAIAKSSIRGACYAGKTSRRRATFPNTRTRACRPCAGAAGAATVQGSASAPAPAAGDAFDDVADFGLRRFVVTGRKTQHARGGFEIARNVRRHGVINGHLIPCAR